MYHGRAQEIDCDMPANVISFMTAASWIAKLGKIYAKGVRSRSSEVDEIANIFGDPEQLAPLYVPPDCLEGNPADRDEDDDMTRPSRPLFEILEDFFARDIKKRDGRRHLFLLADAGMGKTSSLMMLKLAAINDFWPKRYDCRLFKLGPDTLDRVAEIESHRKTILLLDALDEDSKIIDIGVTNRLLELIAKTVNFHRVVITCRTQFFPGVIERPGKIRVADSYICQSLYLAPFSDEQVEDYLKKRFPNRWKYWLTGRDNPERLSARNLAFSIRSLRTRPMLLNHIEDLKEKQFKPDDEFGVYYHLVHEWLRREERKSNERHVEDPDFPAIPLAELFHACAKIAIHMQCHGQRLIQRESLEQLISSDPLVAHIQFVDIGGRSLLNRTAEGEYRFSHYSVQEFLVAYAALTGNLSDRESPVGTIQIVRFVRSGIQYQTVGQKRTISFCYAKLNRPI